MIFLLLDDESWIYLPSCENSHYELLQWISIAQLGLIDNRLEHKRLAIPQSLAAVVQYVR